VFIPDPNETLPLNFKPNLNCTRISASFSTKCTFSVPKLKLTRLLKYNQIISKINLDENLFPHVAYDITQMDPQ
jgi:hypothetical protein